jgi:nodulation protein E
VVVLEELESARKRGAEVYAEIAGVGMSANAFSSVHQQERGAAQAIRAAIDDGRINADEVDYINAHCTGTLVNDRVDSRAIRSVFLGHADSLTVSSTKSIHGHAFGAAGGIELVATLLAMRHRVAPPTANFLEPEEVCDLQYAPNEPQPRRIDVALKQSFAIGGLNAAVALKRNVRLD